MVFEIYYFILVAAFNRISFKNANYLHIYLSAGGSLRRKP